jgi:stage II sporulation protein D
LDGKDVLVRGRGYGHGVGLCQEGAMQMAKYKYNYLQIAIYYFPGVQIHNLAEDAFYNQRGNLFLCSPYRTED